MTGVLLKAQMDNVLDAIKKELISVECLSQHVNGPPVCHHLASSLPIPFTSITLHLLSPASILIPADSYNRTVKCTRWRVIAAIRETGILYLKLCFLSVSLGHFSLATVVIHRPLPCFCSDGSNLVGVTPSRQMFSLGCFIARTDLAALTLTKQILLVPTYI